jgi:hypothetical protein
MKVGDLVKIQDIETSALGIIVAEVTWGCTAGRWWLVEFPTLGYDHEAPESELVVIA